MSTRSAARRASLTPTFPTTHALAIPDDLWLEIFARLPPSDLPSALAAAPDFARLAPFAWRGLALHRWPAWCSVAQAAGVPIRDWRRQAEFFELRDREEAAVAACSRPARESTAGEAAVASPIGPRHRGILVEWLAEVAFEWGTESTVVFKAAAYLDAYLASQQVEDLSQFQLLGIAALRAAMADAAARAESTAAATAASAQPAHGPIPAASGESDASASTSSSDTAASTAGPHAARPRAGRGGRRAPPTARAAPSGLESEAAKEEGGDAKPTTSTAAGPAAAPAAPAAPAPEADDPLDPARFAHVAARTYSPAAVEAATASVVAAAPPALACAPNAKMFLRAFWYRALAAGGVAGGGEAMHVYTLASFFLALALLDAAWPATPASLAAAGALSLALEVCGEAAVEGCPWPAALQAASGHAPAAVAAQRAALRSVQASTQAPHLRRVWAAHHAGHGYAEFKGQWDGVLGVMAEAGEV